MWHQIHVMYGYYRRCTNTWHHISWCMGPKLGDSIYRWCMDPTWGVHTCDITCRWCIDSTCDIYPRYITYMWCMDPICGVHSTHIHGINITCWSVYVGVWSCGIQNDICTPMYVDACVSGINDIMCTSTYGSVRSEISSVHLCECVGEWDPWYHLDTIVICGWEHISDFRWVKVQWKGIESSFITLNQLNTMF